MNLDNSQFIEQCRADARARKQALKQSNADVQALIRKMVDGTITPSERRKLLTMVVGSVKPQCDKPQCEPERTAEVQQPTIRRRITRKS